ncbi:uncharacterized protein [Dermacentor andersoni]|uniref:uncharacterized protein n=1 Tax=Dermacentor andersoni TaxID=34620 RepID=UPI0024162826|nr:uncharacterized protein LOC126518319 [Dermacentor andersoni]
MMMQRKKVTSCWISWPTDIQSGVAGCAETPQSVHATGKAGALCRLRCSQLASVASHECTAWDAVHFAALEASWTWEGYQGRSDLVTLDNLSPEAMFESSQGVENLVEVFWRKQGTLSDPGPPSNATMDVYREQFFGQVLPLWMIQCGETPLTLWLQWKHTRGSITATQPPAAAVDADPDLLTETWRLQSPRWT